MGLVLVLPDVDAAIHEWAPLLKHCPEQFDPVRLLRAFSIVESDGGRNNMPRVEPAYAPSHGRYWLTSPILQADYQRYGLGVAASWGPLQVMYLTARELGYEGPPWYLADPDLGVRWGAELLEHRVLPGVGNLRDIADGYNSGSWRDAIVPGAYIERYISTYQDLEGVA